MARSCQWVHICTSVCLGLNLSVVRAGPFLFRSVWGWGLPVSFQPDPRLSVRAKPHSRHWYMGGCPHVWAWKTSLLGVCWLVSDSLITSMSNYFPGKLLPRCNQLHCNTYRTTLFNRVRVATTNYLHDLLMSQLFLIHLLFITSQIHSVSLQLVCCARPTVHYPKI